MTENMGKHLFGRVVYNARVYDLLEPASISGRQFNGGWMDAEDGGAYTIEYSCAATDNAGDEVIVYWQFPEIKGSEPEDQSDYPWEDDSHIVMVRYMDRR